MPSYSLHQVNQLSVSVILINDNSNFSFCQVSRNFQMFVFTPSLNITVSGAEGTADVVVQVPANTLFDLVCPVPWNVGDTVTWYKNGDILTNAAFRHLVIYDNFIGFPSISESDNGTYTCAVNEDLSTAHSTLIKVISSGVQPPVEPNQGKSAHR